MDKLDVAITQKVDVGGTSNSSCSEYPLKFDTACSVGSGFSFQLQAEFGYLCKVEMAQITDVP